MPVEYKDDDVLTAARSRVSRVFDDFKDVMVSISGGKDSTVLHHLVVTEAERRGRRVTAFFLDQEAEYQVPVWMTNATSNLDHSLLAWESGARWVRDKEPDSVHDIKGRYPKRFYPFFEWIERSATARLAVFVGLRSKESFNRFRAVTKRPGYSGLFWSTKTKNPDAFRFYPIYDWTFGDVWRYIVENDLRYNEHYDRMFAKHGQNMKSMRVSNLLHEKSFRCLADLQEFEPDTYEGLIHRIGGVHCAALYAREGSVLDAKDLPARFGTWRDYRDYLLDTTPLEPRHVARFRKRFSGQPNDEGVHRQQVKQVLINDWENSVPVAKVDRVALRKRWWDEV